jgi:uncharacterized protein (TIGR03545 family)
MRNRFVYFILVPVLFLCVLTLLFIDTWVESGIEYTGESITQARVDIDGLGVSFFPLGIGWERLRVADPSDPWKNIFETGSVQFSLNTAQLIRAKFIVESLAVEEFILGTERETDGRLTENKAPAEAHPSGPTESASSPAEGKKAPVFDLDRIRKDLKLDSLANPANLETYKLIDSLMVQLNESEARWNSTLAEVERTRERVSTIESTVRSIDVNSIRSVEDGQRALKAATEAYEGTRGVITSVDEQRSVLTQQVGTLTVGIASIDDAAKRDYENVVAAAQLPDISMKGLAELVLGRDILAQAEEYLGYADIARSMIPEGSDAPDPEQAKRSEGIAVHFPEKQSYPKVWIKEILLSGGTDSSRDPKYFYATGTIRNITNDQTITGEPITVDLHAQKGSETKASFRALFDRREELPFDEYAADVTGIEVADMPLGSSTFLPSKITDARSSASMTVSVPGNSLESSAKISFGALTIMFDREPSNAVERLTRDVLRTVQGFFIQLRIWKNEENQLDVSFQTDLDSQLSGRARSVIGAEVTRLRNQIRQRVDEQIAEKRRGIETAYAQKKAAAQRRLSAAVDEIGQKVAVVEKKKKELEDRVEQEKKKAEDALKKKAGDALKGLFKKN